MDPTTPLNIAVCEDTQAEAEELIASIAAISPQAQLACFASGEELLAAFAPGTFDIIFMDIYMQGLTGIQTIESVRALDSQVVVVFVTTSEDYTLQSYKLNAYKYILKPIQTEDVTDALELAQLKRDKEKGMTLNVASSDGPQEVKLDDIVYIEAHNRLSHFHMSDGREIESKTTLDAFEKFLPAPRFLRSHRSNIANLDHVVDIDEDFIMDNGERVYIKVKEAKRMRQAYDDYLFSRLRNS
jgi:DNA-binding LytR/AlgR family response regulator